jgi:ectoine hydroxylase-related dioxygenase (phytanoyl-CoA dioxygenase family)
VLNPHKSVPAIDRIMHDPRVRQVTELLLGAQSIPFESISGHKASQQATHSDSIHMTTYPEGYLVAMWIAFEDIGTGSGPLVYFPGSHRLSVFHSADVGISPDDFKKWGYREFDAKYTPTIGRLIDSEQLEPSRFHAKRGDVLFWHANLLHGGSTRTDFSQTRKALVFHFFAEGCVCYHDLRGQLAWVNGKPLTGPAEKGLQTKGLRGSRR